MTFKKLVLSISILFIIASCSTKNALLGTWKLSKVNIEKAISPFEGEQKNFAKVIMTEAFKNVKGKMKLSFSENGKFQMETPLMDNEIKKEKGTWKLSKDKKKLFINTNDSGKEMHRILKLTDNKLVLEMAQSGFGPMEMTFTKE